MPKMVTAGRDALVVPSYQRRRLAAPKPPLGAARAYQEALRKWLSRLQEQWLKLFLEGWDRNPVHFSGTVPRVKEDAVARTPPGSSYVRERLGSAEVILQEAIQPGSQLSRDVRTLAARVNKKGDIEFRRVVGISPRGGLGLGAALDSFRDKNVNLIKSLAGQQLDEITSILANAEIGALRVEEVRTQIINRFGVGQSKADLLARDQILKLNGQLTQVRQEGVGITQYIWTTSHDERVRGDPGGKWPNGLHYQLDGTVQSWTAPPICSLDGRREHPGGDYQCRCTAFPILPELNAEQASLDEDSTEE